MVAGKAEPRTIIIPHPIITMPIMPKGSALGARICLARRVSHTPPSLGTRPSKPSMKLSTYSIYYLEY